MMNKQQAQGALTKQQVVLLAHGGMHQYEIAETLGLSQVHVRRLIKGTDHAQAPSRKAAQLLRETVAGYYKAGKTKREIAALVARTEARVAQILIQLKLEEPRAHANNGRSAARAFALCALLLRGPHTLQALRTELQVSEAWLLEMLAMSRAAGVAVVKTGNQYQITT